MEAHAQEDRPRRKGERTRDLIVTTATELFSREGFRATSLREIASKCGLSHPGLLYHFPTKEALLEAVLERRDAEDLERFRRSGSRGTGGLGVLRGMVALAEFNTSAPGLIELFAVLSTEATAPDHPAHAYFVRRYERIRSGTRRALERAREAGYLREGVDVEDTAVELTALMDGLQVQWLLDPDLDMPALVRKRIQRLLVVEL